MSKSLMQCLDFLVLFSLCRATWEEIRGVNLLMMGDSVMRKQRDYIHQFNLISRRHLDCKSPYFHFSSNESIISSVLNSTHIFDKGGDGKRDRFNVVYTNFGVLHLLHLHPTRSWTSVDGEVDRVANGSMQASFKGFYNLEKWMRRDLGLLLSTHYIDLVILLTPNVVCSSRFFGKYSDWFQSVEPLSRCIDYVLHEAVTDDDFLQTTFFARPPKQTFSRDNAADLCARGSLSSNGTTDISRMMKGIVDSIKYPNLKLVDGTNITAVCGCDCTKDGRHYNDDVVTEQASVLMETITDFLKLKVAAMQKKGKTLLLQKK